MTGIEHINKTYGVNACVGRRVVANGKPGVIIGTNNSHLAINLDEDKPGVPTYWHPMWNMQYLEMGAIRKMTAGQKRYQEYQDADWFDGTFAEWLGVDKKSKERRLLAKDWEQSA